MILNTKLKLSTTDESGNFLGGMMRRATRLFTVMMQILLLLCIMATSSHAAIHTLLVKRDAVTVAEALVDDTAAYTGLYSLKVDNTQRLFQQWFWYRLGATGGELSLDTLTLKSVSPPTEENPGALSLTYTLADQFDITISYLLAYPAGGNASVTKTVTIANISSVDISYHLFEYSDFDISSIGNDNVYVANNRIYQNSILTDTSGVTLVHESSLLPDRFDIDGAQSSVLPSLKDSNPTDLANPVPYRYEGELQFACQWDLSIPAGQSVNFTITDTLYPTLPLTAAKTHAGACVAYQGQADYTITYDNIANSSGLTNVKIIDYLPANTVISATPPSNDGIYDSSTNTVTWNPASLAAGAAQQTETASITVNSSVDITNEALLVSDQAFPTRITDLATLCNHPPAMNAIANASIIEGTAYSTQVVASDSDNETLVYSLGNAPAGMSISAAGLISWPVSAIGTYVITVTATDPGDLSASRTFTLTVNKFNHPPVITSTPVTATDDMSVYTYTITATDEDGDPLSYGVVGPYGMTLTGNVVSWTPPLVSSGGSTYSVAVTVSDGQGSNTSQSFTLAVAHVNHPPVISTATPPPTTATVGVLYSYKVTASDPEYNTITYSLPVCPTGMTIGTTGSIAWTPAAGQNNNVHDVTVKVTDSLGAYSTLSYSITVGTYVKQTPVLTWATPVAINYGTALSATQLNATASVPGSFVYSPAIGAVLNTGSQTLSVTFTPTDTARYTTATASVTLTVNPAVATVSLGGLSQTYDGSAKPATVTTTPAGLGTTVTYNGSAVAPTAVGSYAVVATITDANYSGSASGTLIIAKATPAITWATPAPITYGTALSATQLNATADVPGSFVYSPVSGSILNAGSQTLSATFTPTDTTNYNSTTANVQLTVNPAVATVVLGGLSQTYDGSAKTATATTTPAGLEVTFTYNGTTVAPTAAGSYAVVATVNDANYTGSASGTLTVSPAAATVVLGNLSQIYDGTAKTITASTTPAGLSTVITYNGSATAPSAVGSYAVVAIISDGNYSGSASGTLTIAPTAVIGTTSYTSLQAAYTDAADGALIQSLEGTLTETVTAAENIAVKMKGGYNSAYDTNSGFTTIQGQVLLRAGTLRVERIKVK